MLTTVQARKNGNPTRVGRQILSPKAAQSPAQPATDQLHGLVKLEEAISAASAVLLLLAEKTADYRQQLGINDDDDGLTSGLLNLAEQAGDRLKADFRTLTTTLRESEVKA